LIFSDPAENSLLVLIQPKRIHCLNNNRSHKVPVSVLRLHHC
jgi:hypothetical protein